MHKLKKIFYILFSIFFSLIVLFIIFLKWNDNPPLDKRSNNSINKLQISEKGIKNIDNLKIVSYNIHFGIGFDRQTKRIEKKDYESRLDELAETLKNIDADIVCLQEVDFNSKRSCFIDQAMYIAKKAGFKYIAKAPTFRKKINLFYHFIIGPINQGLCILSKYPILKSESLIFSYPLTLPTYIKWLLDPHGAQSCMIKINNKIVNIINLHLDPWFQKIREKQIKNVLNDFFYKNQTLPTSIVGDFNALSWRENKKIGFYQKDRPWFIKNSGLNIKNDKTTLVLLENGFQEFPSNAYIKKYIYLTFPANNPKEKIDHIFINDKFKPIKGYIYKNAKISSDHLPIVAEIQLF